jgi:hypothetical protein
VPPTFLVTVPLKWLIRRNGPPECRYCGRPIRFVEDRRGLSFWRHRQIGAGGCESIRSKAAGGSYAKRVPIEPR